MDSMVGVLLGYPDKESARPLALALSHTEGDSRYAGLFRLGQLARLDGELDRALVCFEQVAAAFADRPEAAAGVAAARSEQAEVHLLRGDTRPAVEAYEAGMALHKQAGRQALMFRSDAGRTRAMTEAGVAVLTDGLTIGVSFAIARKMALLEVDLRIARGMATAASDAARAQADLEAAIRIADRCQSRMRAGRARYEAATRLAISDLTKRKFLSLAEGDVAASAPLLARVRAAKERMDQAATLR